MKGFLADDIGDNGVRLFVTTEVGEEIFERLEVGAEA